MWKANFVALLVLAFVWVDALVLVQDPVRDVETVPMVVQVTVLTDVLALVQGAVDQVVHQDVPVPVLVGVDQVVQGAVKEDAQGAVTEAVALAVLPLVQAVLLAQENAKDAPIPVLVVGVVTVVLMCVFLGVITTATTDVIQLAVA